MSHTNTLVIRDARASDLGAVSAIERRSFSAPWSAAMFRTHLQGDVNQFIVAVDTAMDTTVDRGGEGDGAVIGYALAHVVADESELLNIAVHPDRRGHAIGGVLLDAVMDRCHTHGALFMVLDVRESNTSARALYERRGFAIVGRRRCYYQLPNEDALLMRADLSG